MNHLIDLAVEAAQLAGNAILKHYRKNTKVEYKEDRSPLTVADKEAHQVIVNHLTPSSLAVVSEEGEDLSLDLEHYWLVDPLDGTKDFLECNDEFTVNIAIIKNGRPVMGVVFAPAINDLYWGAKGKGGWNLRNGRLVQLRSKPRSQTCRMVVSRFHNHPDEEKFMLQNKINQNVAVGSALKYALLASAEVDVYPRLVGSSEWDTAAGQALLESVGGHMLDWDTGKPLSYGKFKRRNPRLLVMRAPYFREDFKLVKYGSELL